METSWKCERAGPLCGCLLSGRGWPAGPEGARPPAGNGLAGIAQSRGGTRFPRPITLEPRTAFASTSRLRERIPMGHRDRARPSPRPTTPLPASTGRRRSEPPGSGTPRSGVGSAPPGPKRVLLRGLRRQTAERRFLLLSARGRCAPPTPRSPLAPAGVKTNLPRERESARREESPGLDRSLREGAASSGAREPSPRMSRAKAQADPDRSRAARLGRLAYRGVRPG